MTDNMKAVDVGGVKVQLDGNTRILFSKGTTATGQNTIKVDNASYQVPAGKKTRIIYSLDFPSSAVTDRLYQSDSEDANSNEVLMFQTGQTSNVTNIITIGYVAAAAGKYINFSTSGADTYAIYLIEEDA